MKNRLIMKKYILFISVILLISCSDITCPGFPESLVSYYPYQAGETLRFCNDSNDTLSLKIADYYLTLPHSLDWNTKCCCSSMLYFITEEDSTTRMQITGHLNYYNDDEVTEVNFHILKVPESSEYFSSFIGGANPNMEEHENLFPDTIILMNDISSRFGNIIIVKSIGLTGFRDNESNCNWLLVQ